MKRGWEVIVEMKMIEDEMETLENKQEKKEKQENKEKGEEDKMSPPAISSMWDCEVRMEENGEWEEEEDNM